MKAIIDADGECIAIVFDTAGHDLTGCTVLDEVPEPVHEHAWSQASQAFVPRPPNAQEELTADAHWSALKTATPSQIEAWLANNVNTLSEARRVLKLILLALRALHARRAL